MEGLEDDGKGGFKVGAALIGGTGTVVDAVVGNTIGRAGKIIQNKVLGGMVNEALEGSFQTTVTDETEGEAAVASVASVADLLPQATPKLPKPDFGDKKLVVVTGTSSGLGRATTNALLRTGKCA